MSAATVIPSLLPLIVVAAMRRAEARVCRQLAAAGAVAAESAIPLSPGRSMERRRLEGLVQGGAVRMVADSRYYLDTDGWGKFQRNRRRRALLAFSVVVALVGVVLIVALSMR